MSRKLHTYEADDIVVEYDAKRCIHVAECVRGLPRVFDPQGKPWVDPGLGAAAEVAAVVERCPTGALHYTRRDGGAAETPDGENTGRVSADGPLFLRGRIRLELPGGRVLQDTRVALCRCGASRDKPFCDGSHAEAGFSDPGRMGAGRLVPAERADGGEAGDEGGGDGGDANGDADAADRATVTISCRADGPLMVRGPLRIEGTDGGVSAGEKGALCRCGASAAKPFCDGSHRDNGFAAEGS
jgi:CDGSH-type Zn-finger protein/uncharacterized Fe-S cluster protein YjdI